MKGTKTQKGITLIALIITIVVLMILAAVTINSVKDGGIITHAQDAANDYTVASEKEQIQLGYSEYIMSKEKNKTAELRIAGATVTGDEENGWTVTFEKTGNRYVMSSKGEITEKPKTQDEIDLETYFLGQDRQGLNLMSLATSTNEAGLPAFEKGDTLAFYAGETAMVGNILVKYNDKAYKIKTEYDLSDQDNIALISKSEELVYEPSGREGQKITFSHDGATENETEWTILYDNETNVEIVCPSTLGSSLTLGSNDKNALGSTDIEKAVYSYNNAITRINTYAANLVTNTNKISVRNVGSNPNNPFTDNVGYYASENLKTWNSSYNGVGKISDNNSEKDLIRMSYWGVSQSSDSADYFYASRTVIDDGEDIMFNVDTSDGKSPIWGIRNNGTILLQSAQNTYAVRPIVKINMD